MACRLLSGSLEHRPVDICEMLPTSAPRRAMLTQPEAQNKKEVVIIHFKALKGCQIVQLCALVLEYPRFYY